MTKRLILTILFFGSPLWATTYYVDNCVTVGNDLSNGASPSTPWLTINKVNASKFNPGDSILFQSTCTWREQLTAPSSGSAGSPITIGAYGTGAAPIISGADVFSSWITEGSLYYSSASVQPNQVFLDGQRLTLAASKAALATGQWWWDSTNNRIYIYDDPSGHTMEASQRQYGVFVYTAYTTVTGLHATKAGSFGFSLGADYVTASGLIADYNYDDGIHGGGADYTLTNSTVAYNGACGIFFTNSNNFLISRNIAHHNGQLAIDSNQNYTAGIRFGLYQLGNGTVQYNLVYDQAQGGIDSGMGINYDTTTSPSSHVTIQYNETYGNYGSGIRVDLGQNVVVLANVIYGNLGGNNSAALWCAYSASGNKIYNNTVYGNVVGISNQGYGGAGAIVNNVFENNVSVNNSTANFSAWWGGENDGIMGYGNVYTYNDFGAQASNFIRWGGSSFPGTGYSTYAAWETATGNCGTAGCSHSVQADPQFVNPAAAQFWLQSGSPAIDAGLNLGSPYNIGLLPGSSWPNSVLTGDQNAYGSGWEMGAFLYVPTITPPSNLQAVAH